MSKSIFDIEISSLDGCPNLLGQLRGKVLLHVNVVSKTGYSPKCSRLWSYARTAKNFWELQKLHEEFCDSGFSVVGYPCNQFGNMENGDNLEIFENIKKNYPYVTFPIAEKIDVNGQNRHDVYSFLNGELIRNFNDSMADLSAAAAAGRNRAGEVAMRVPNNWEKFLTSREGVYVGRFNWAESPISEQALFGEDNSIKQAIRSLL
jgi:glutathione peroxidase